MYRESAAAIIRLLTGSAKLRRAAARPRKAACHAALDICIFAGVHSPAHYPGVGGKKKEFYMRIAYLESVGGCVVHHEGDPAVAPCL